MTRTDLLFNELKNKFQKMGFSLQDPVIVNVLGILSNAPKSTERDVALLEGKIESLLKLDDETLKGRLNSRKKKEIDAKEAAAQTDEKNQKALDEDWKQDQEQNQDLFILTTKGNDGRIVDREEQQMDLQDRQIQIAEKSLRVLEAMEKARDAIVKGKEIPEIDLSYLKDLTPKEFAKQMAVFKTFGLQPVMLGRDGQVREDQEREVTLETITREEVEQGDIGFSIPFDQLRTSKWRSIAERSKEFFKQKGIKPEYEPETTIEDDVINAIAGNKNTKSPTQRNVGDDELDR